MAVGSYEEIPPAGVATPVSIANGGTNSSTALVNGRVMVSSGDAIVESSVLFSTASITGASTTSNYLRITATLPTVLSAQTIASNFQITTAGSSNSEITGQMVSLLAGYTGANTTEAIFADNNCAGTASAYMSGSGNYGVFARSIGTTTGTNTGFGCIARNGDISIGVHGRTITAKNSAVNLAVLGTSLNTGSSPVQIGGFFALMSTQPTLAASAALMADNSSTTSDIFVARDNGTATFTVADGGGVASTLASTSSIGLTIKGAASRSVALLNLQTSAGGSLGTVGGTTFDHNSDITSTSTDGTFNTIWSDTTIANALALSGDKIVATYTMTFVSSATATRNVKVAFAGINILDTGALTFAATGTAVIRVTIIRCTSSTCRATVEFDPAGSATILGFHKCTYTPEATLTGLTLSGTNILLVTAAAAGAGAASADIVGVMATVGYFPAA